MTRDRQVSGLSIAMLCGCAIACEPTVLVGYRFCSEAPAALGDEGDAGASADASDAQDATVLPALDAEVGPLPWSTGFEDGFCDYAWPAGFCIATGASSYTIVTSPVHTGRYAAAFTVNSAQVRSQSRCVTQGVFPTSAYYGAWYYVPASAQNNNGVWNLLHFLGDGPAGAGLWDVSLVNVDDGGPLAAVLYDFVNSTAFDSRNVWLVPIGRWFHVEVYFKRAKDKTGQLELLLDDQPAVTMLNIPTDQLDAATHWGQWYVGNLATALTPSNSTIYVDDIAVALSP